MSRRGTIVLQGFGGAALVVAGVLLIVHLSKDEFRPPGVWGKVVRADGTPCVGAVVVLTPLLDQDCIGDGILVQDGPDDTGWALVMRLLAGRGEPRETVTDAGGVYRFGDLEPGGYVLIAFPRAAPETGSENVEVTFDEAARVDLAAPETRMLRGRVTVGSTGEPAAGARVHAHMAPDLLTTTDTDGRYELEGIGLGQNVVVEVEGFPAHRASLRRDGANFVGDVAVWPGGTVGGRVVDPSGAPVVEASVLLARPSTVSCPSVPDPWLRETRTDPAGRFSIADVPGTLPFRLLAVTPDGRIGGALELVTFCAPGEAGLGFSWERTLLPVGGRIDDILLTVRQTGVLRVVVTTEDGSVPGDARVESLDDPVMGRAIETAEGGVLSRRLIAGPYHPRVRQEGYVAATAEAIVRAGETTEARLVLRPGTTIEGRVLLPDGRPAARAFVMASPVDDVLAGMDASDRNIGADADRGVFILTGCEPGREYAIWAYVDEVASAPIVVPAGTTGVDLNLVSGAVRARFPGAGVGAVDTTRFELVGQGPYRRWLEYQLDDPYDPERDESGAFVWNGVAPGSYHLRESRVDSLRSYLVTVPPGGTAGVEIDAARDPRVAIPVRWSDGRPAAGLDFTLRLDSDPAWEDLVRTGTGEDGTVTLPRPPAGTYVVVLDSRVLEMNNTLRHTTIRVPAEGPIPPVDAGPRTAGALAVRVVDEAGRQVAGALVTLRDGAGRVVTTGADLSRDEIESGRKALRAGGSGIRLLLIAIHVGPAGSFTDLAGGLLRGSLEPDRYTAEIGAEGFEPARFGFEVRAGERVRRTVELERR